jgi:hypothetical protein
MEFGPVFVTIGRFRPCRFGLSAAVYLIVSSKERQQKIVKIKAPFRAPLYIKVKRKEL